MQKAPKVTLSVRQKAIIERLAHSRTEEQRVVERAQIVLLSSSDELCVVTAQKLGVDAQRVRRWRKRFAEAHGVLLRVENEPKHDGDLENKIRELFSDEYRCGTPATFSPEQITCIIALACETPEDLGLPISHWTPDDLARQAVKLKIVKSISGRHVDRFLKRSRLASASDEVLAESKHRKLRSLR